jgi:hypothetical protein
MKFTCIKTVFLTLILSSGLFVNNANAGIIVSDNTSVTSDGQSYTSTFDVTGFEDYINLIFTVSTRGDYGVSQDNEYIEFFIDGISFGQFRYDTSGVISSVGASGQSEIDWQLDFSFSITDIDWSTLYADDSTITVNWSNDSGVGAWNSEYNSFVNFNLAGDPNPVPEPTTLAIFALGMMGLAVRRLNKNS